MLAKAHVIGRLGQDPEIKTTKKGKTMATFSVATDSGFGDNKKTLWHNVVVFDEKVVNNVIEPFVKKGTQIFIMGDIDYQEWEDNGVKKTKTQIIVNFNSEIKLLGGTGNTNGHAMDVPPELAAKADASVDISDDLMID